MYTILLSAGWPIWPLLALSIFGLAILMERSWYLRQQHIAPQADLEVAFGLAEGIASGKAAPAGLIQDLRQSSVIGTLLASILSEKQAGHSAGQAIEELAVLADTSWVKLERYLGALATIATLAPLLGLFGTVVGMIEIFGSQGIVTGSGGNPQQLANGISIALYNTAFGLLIAIPAYAGWRGLRAMADGRQRECEELARQLFKKLYPENT
jgi:biopolymer transport protein ExbB